MSKLKVGLLYGGVSQEREVSLLTGQGVKQALENNGHEVIAIDFHPEKLIEIVNLAVDVVFIGLHGKYGEDGSIQGLLDMLNIPYVGSGVLASSLAMDKYTSKKMFKTKGIPVAEDKQYRISTRNQINEVVNDVNDIFHPPFVVKPNREGSTLGLTVVTNQTDTEEAIKKAFECDEFVLVEQYIDGIELTVPILGNLGEEEALPIIEIVPKNDLYDYESKYSEGGSEHIIPARIDETITKKIQSYAVAAHRVLGCKTYSRADFLLTKEGTPYILEVNTLPGMTPTSLFPDAARVHQLSYDEMIEKLIQLSIKK